jgi:hypothetical protein
LKRDIRRTIAIETSEREIRVKIPTDGMSPTAIRAFVDWLRMEVAARRSHLTGEVEFQYGVIDKILDD